MSYGIELVYRNISNVRAFIGSESLICPFVLWIVVACTSQVSYDTEKQNKTKLLNSKMEI